jgi:hypothetical protein
MDGDRFDLYFGSLKVGVVTQSNSDFPNLWGNIAYDPALVEPRSAELARFVKFVVLNRESTRLLDREHEHDTSREQEAVGAELAAHYMDFVESEDWHLIDNQGRLLPILCPILRGDGEIVWRWNPGEG